MNETKGYRREEDLEKLKGDLEKLKEGLEKLLVAAHPAYVSDNHFREKLIAARDEVIKTLEKHRPDKEAQQ